VGRGTKKPSPGGHSGHNAYLRRNLKHHKQQLRKLVMIQVNEYFGGAVKSLGYESAAGKSTVGVMEAGEYEFGTSQHEIMTIVEGELAVLFQGVAGWQVFGPGQVFEVAANSSFKVKAQGQTSYLCQYR
jgi:purine/pyrimidine-nucleoside phosphorylase